ncbi:unnamed protein product [Durusdinium trenchii]|uniref:Protein kinase domain-containing protein n=1 Tax=Durusdinium trenchii TaxID=1381693 RepID=A0ABP0ITL0_9DINO
MVLVRAVLASGEEVELRLAESSTLASLRQQLQEHLEVPAGLQRLFLGSKEVMARYDADLQTALELDGAGEESETLVTVVVHEMFVEVDLPNFRQKLPHRFQLERPLMSGTAKHSFRFRDTFTGEQAEVIFHEHGRRNPDVVTTLVKEIFCMQHLEHPNLPELLKVPPLCDDHLCLMMRCMDTNLHRVLQSQQELTEEHVMFFTYQLLEALCFLHSADVVYFDLAPWKIGLSRTCDLRLRDFEGARRVGQRDGRAAADGPYHAPEYFRSFGRGVQAETSSDLWSAGCILYEMYKRQPLFARDLPRRVKTLESLFGRPEGAPWSDVTAAGSPTPPVDWLAWVPTASQDACALLQQMIHWEPSQRCSCQEALQSSSFKEIRDPEDAMRDVRRFPLNWATLEKICSEEHRCVDFLEDAESWSIESR